VPNIYIVLVEPQMGENIGAAARVMSNFGFDNLRIVNPRDGWPNPKANDMSAHGLFVLEKAKIYKDVESAIADLNFVCATSAQKRYMNKDIISATEITKELSLQNENSNIGILFGRERSGLTNEELGLADKLIKIPVSNINPSLNLAQAVGIVCYELSKFKNFEIEKNHQILASKDELSYFLKTLDDNLINSGFLRNEKMRPTMIQNIRNIFTRAQLTEQDIRTLHGMLNSLKKMT
jgi:tRNA/rRNA methyltransferase